MAWLLVQGPFKEWTFHMPTEKFPSIHQSILVGKERVEASATRGRLELVENMKTPSLEPIRKGKHPLYTPAYA